MESFSQLPEEFRNPFLSTFGLLKFCNIVLFDERSFFMRFMPLVYILPSATCFYAASTIYLIEGLKRGMAMDELVFVVPIYVVLYQTILKSTIVTSNTQKLRSIIVRLGEMWRTEGLSEQQNNKKTALLKRLRFCFAVFYWMNKIAAWQYLMSPLVVVLFRTFFLQQKSDFLLPLGWYIPFDMNDWPIYIFVYVLECYSAFLMVYCYLGTEFLMIIVCSHLGTEFTMLHQDLLLLNPAREPTAHFNANANESTNSGHLDQKVALRDLIRRHQTLIALAQDLDSIFNKMIFVNLSSASIIICFFGFSAKVAKDTMLLLTNFGGLVASVLPIFNLCYYGQFLKESSEGIADAAFKNQWLLGKGNYKKCICFIIMRSQRPSILTSLKYNPIALSTFTTVMSTTWSYFSLASSVYDMNHEDNNNS